MELEQRQLTQVIERIKSVRNQKAVSQLELSLRSGLSQSFIASVESGKKQPSALTIIKIANALDVSPRVFFPENNNMNRQQIKDAITSLLDAL
jgi:transcriptional regulator with XRE-family HTH domain